MRRVPASIGLLFVTVLLAVGAPASAHTPSLTTFVSIPTGPMNEVIAAAPAAPAIPVAVLALFAAVALAGMFRPRRAVALTLVLVVALLAFETGVHSVHHL